MNMRLIVALVLSILVLLLYQSWMGSRLKKEAPDQQKIAEGQRREGEEKWLEEERQAPRVPEAKPQLATGVTYEDVVVDTPLYTATFTTYGARLKTWSLKEYNDKVPMHPLGKFVQNLVGSVLGRDKADDSPAQAIDLVNTEELEYLPLGMSLRAGVQYDESIPFVPSSKKVVLEENGEKADLLFQWNGPTGVRILRKYSFFADTYEVDTDVVIGNSRGGGVVNGTLGLTWQATMGETKRFRGFYGPVYYGGGKLEKIKSKKLKNEDKVVRDVEWFGFDQDYFISLIYPASDRKKLILSRESGERIAGQLLSPVEVQSGDTARVSYRLFLGPKVRKLLAEVGPTTKKAVDYGWFGFLAIPILQIVNFTNKFTGNYGVDIILLSVFLKIIFTPLTHKSQQSMKAMQKLQPELKRLQQKYKGDKQALNREMMELYKRRKVNPFSGCLPMLVQLPVFFALYQGLLNSIELRHSPFILWIRDLADKDPTYISPLLMGASMFLQQKMTTMPTADPTQAKMMMLMPIFFTFIFLSFPSGLVLYWLVTNILTIAHQMYVNRRK